MQKNTDWRASFTRAILTTGRALKALFFYIIFFRWVIDIVRWLLDVGGTIAESAFLLATTYVIINLVAHQLVLWLVFGNTNVIDTCNQVALIAFSVLPELIVISAIKKSYQMWVLSFESKRFECFVWSVLFTLPTLIFVAMTIKTISGFVSIESAGQTYTLTGTDLITRVVSGFVYGASQKLYAEIGQGVIDNLYGKLKHQLQDAATLIAERETTIANLQTTITTLQSDMATLQNDLVALRIAQAQKHTHTKRQRPVEQKTTTGPVTHIHTDAHTQESETRAKLKELMRQTVTSGQPLNMKEIATKAGVHYNTGLRHKESILQEITKEHPAIQLVREA